MSRQMSVWRMRVFGTCARSGLVLAAVTAMAGAQRTLPADGRLVVAQLQFTAHATVGTFVGTTTNARGAYRVGVPGTPASGYVEFDAKTLATGNTTRDAHMREALEADTHPVIRFALDSVAIGQAAGDSTAVAFVGQLTVRGVPRRHQLSGWIHHRDGRHTLQTAFPVSLKEHGVVRNLSRFFGTVKVDDGIVIRATLTFEGTVP